MDNNKVLSTQRVYPPNGPLGSYPQTTPKNPSQTNGNRPPPVPPMQREFERGGSDRK